MVLIGTENLRILIGSSSRRQLQMTHVAATS